MLIHSFVQNSIVNGPGKRFTLWTQGCTKACKNCYNPETWHKHGFDMNVENIVNLIKITDAEGFTITGGDPLEQPDELLELLKITQKLNLEKGIILFTGYTLQEIESIGGNTLECLSYIDLLIDGRYQDDSKTFYSLRGSNNQNFHFYSNKIKLEDVEFDHEIEIGNSNNLIYLTGFPNLNKNELKNMGLTLK